MSEKRSLPRLSRDWEIEFQMSKQEREFPNLARAVIRDIGAGGVRFKSESGNLPESLFQFAIRPNDEINPLVGVAKLAWTLTREEGYYECGAQFVWVRWKGVEAQAAIAQYVLDKMAAMP